jgi:hypothetical protein
MSWLVRVQSLERYHSKISATIKTFRKIRIREYIIHFGELGENTGKWTQHNDQTIGESTGSLETGRASRRKRFQGSKVLKSEISFCVERQIEIDSEKKKSLSNTTKRFFTDHSKYLHIYLVDREINSNDFWVGTFKSWTLTTFRWNEFQCIAMINHGMVEETLILLSLRFKSQIKKVSEKMKQYYGP